MFKYRFSIIVPHYDGVISDEVFMEGMSSLAASTFKDFEVLIYHDGPTSRPLPDVSKLGFDYKLAETKKRYNDWGHSLRDIGIREAQGEYIVHFNPDNILHESAMANINKTIITYEEFFATNKPIHDTEINKKSTNVVVCPIIMNGCMRIPGGPLHRTNNPKHNQILDGFPPVRQNIDCMQVVASRKAWLNVGGWKLKHEESDGDMIERLIAQNSFITCQQIIGVHR